MSARSRVCPAGTLAAVLAALSVVSPAPARAERALRAAGPAPHAPASAQRLSLAAEHFGAGRYAAARQLFDELLAGDAGLGERDTIAFNAAVASYALAEYADALRRFRDVERAHPRLAALARINAGFAALRSGDLALAERQARALEPLAQELEVRRQKLLAELEQTRELARGEARQQELEVGFTELAEQRWQSAREHFARALSGAPGSDRETLADAHYGLGLAAAQLGETQAAQRHFEQSLRLRPHDGRSLLGLAQLAEDGADPLRAERAYESALEQPLDESEQRDAQRGLLRLYPLPRSGPTAYLALGAGIDGNATQSGSGDLLATGAPERQSSPYASGLVELGMALRASRRSALGLSYTGDVLALLHAGVDDSSLQAHELVARWQWAPTPALRWRLDAGVAHVLAGLSPVRSFEWDGVLALTMDLQTGARSRARVQLGDRLVQATELSYLDGHRLHLLATEIWSLGGWELSLQGALRYVSAGTERVALAADALESCSPSCERRSYHNPYSYWSPALGAGLGWQAIERLRFASQLRAEYRGYLEQSSITGIPDSHDLRRDLRLRGQLGAELSLDEAGRFRVTLDQTLLASISSVAWDPAHPSHQYDYGDRNFLQPTTELGVSASFP